jgi:hypothetical protein
VSAQFTTAQKRDDALLHEHALEMQDSNCQPTYLVGSGHLNMISSGAVDALLLPATQSALPRAARPLKKLLP